MASLTLGCKFDAGLMGVSHDWVAGMIDGEG